MQTVPKSNYFSSISNMDIKSDAELALRLVLFLQSRQSRNGAWANEHPNAMLRNTCHVLEAFSVLNWSACRSVQDHGLTWLVNLPEMYQLDDEDQDSLRLHPSRFKTLALCGGLRDTQAKEELQQLEASALTDEGLLKWQWGRGDLQHTIVYVDCAILLPRGEVILKPAKYNAALQQVEAQLSAWHNPSAPNHREAQTLHIGILSYGLDILLRTNQWHKMAATSQAICRSMRRQITEQQLWQNDLTNALYSAIQLSNHFADNLQIYQEIGTFLSHLRTYCLTIDWEKEELSRLSLILRAFAAFYDERLPNEMTNILLEQERSSSDQRDENEREQQKSTYEALLRDRFRIRVVDVKPLSGGLTQEEIFRVQYALHVSGAGGSTADNSFIIHPGQSIVVKSGSLDSLRRAVQTYQMLPDSIGEYFARHTGEPRILEADWKVPAHLVLEDLTEKYQTFRDIFRDLDQRIMGQQQRDDLQNCCVLIAQTLASVYDQTQKSDAKIFGFQISRLYTSRIEKALIKMSDEDRHKHLRTYFNGFRLGNIRHYPSIRHYLDKIDSHKSKLKIPLLMLTHGDCHSRNIMLDSTRERLKLIDLDKLEKNGDYISDFAQLIEDIAIFRFLFEEEYIYYRTADAIKLGPKRSGSSENRIEYQPLTSVAARQFQRNMLELIGRYAASIGDHTWKARLWLALAVHLLALAPKHPNGEQATVLYVEAVKLLQALTEYFENDIPLGEIPFPERHPRQQPLPPFTGHKGLRNLHEQILALSPHITEQRLHQNQQIVKYHIPAVDWPFTILDAEKAPPRIYLACEPSQLAHIDQTFEAVNSMGQLKSAVTYDNQRSQSHLLQLIQEVIWLNTSADR